MLVFRFGELLRARERQLSRRVTLAEVAEATGISVQVLSSLRSPGRTVVTNTAFVESLCRYFNCSLEHLLEFDPPQDAETACHIDELYPDRRTRQ
ncbi:MAG: XRE family transcriptional regulator [Planctomycetota bacterium]|nr:MAG: XRE family transcriptional regulator [Planctomycetota bacterium]REK25946.1 MAG: XRE family transcriptional regulator [Planctomycetota bacterium]REK46938.1 MAG: XRE family transcriptional regulator [Planctomycetota bacterium]